MKTNLKAINEILSSRYIERIYPSKKRLRQILKFGRRLTIYIGIDPTAPYLHLGHSTNFLLLKKFQALGHKVILLIGDFTARIGDPTGKLSARKPLDKSDILRNCRNYKAQVEKILNFNLKGNPAMIKFNSKWLSRIKLGKVIELMAKTTVGKIIKRGMFQKRIKEKKEIYLHEFLYPLLQGYDSIAMKVDIEVGGNDQTFNMMVGRELTKDYLNKEKIVIATKLLINPKTQRKLMSKSEGNFIALDEKPNHMYGKIMALPDEVILPVFNLCTELENKEIKKIEKLLKKNILNPMEAKAKLGRTIVKMYYGGRKAETAAREFKRVFKERKLPLKIQEFIIGKKQFKILELLVKLKLASSKSEARRLILQKGVKIDGVLQTDWRKIIKTEKGQIIQAGKRKFVKIK